MKHIIQIILLALVLQSCKEKVEISSIDPVNWGKRTITQELPESFTKGSTYLSIYSQIYGQTVQRTYDLTVTVSMRNTNVLDTIFLNNAKYYNTKGDLIRTYFDKTIFIAPMETVEIIIDERDKTGGTGANFIFDWEISESSHEPFFEAIMISTSGQQGLSFTTQGKRIK